MALKLIPPVVFFILLCSCSNLKQLGFSTNTQANTISANNEQNASQEKPAGVKFLNNISVSAQETQNNPADLQNVPKKGPSNLPTPREIEYNTALNNNSNENSLALQMKYAALLNTDVSQIQNKKLFEYIDEWYGTRYCMGGTTKNCIDCSAFVQSLIGAIYGITVPRTAITQYKTSKRISTTELKEGDLLFFHTRRNHGLVTHVGIYLQNNKFVHASSSDGVTISDMYEPYYVQHLIAAGRIIE